MPGNPQSLRVAPGQPIRTEDHNGLVRLAERLTWQRGRMKGRRMPDGFLPRVEAQVILGVEHPFRVLTAAADEKLFATFTTGHVNGIVPKIGKLALDMADENGNPPRLEIPRDAWKPYGTGERAIVMLRYDLTADFLVSAVTPVALPAPPSAALPRQWHKLCALLYRQDGTVRVRQRIFFDQYFTASGGTPAGRFTAWPRVA